jgi:hydroxypyruvate reductase
MSRDHALSIWRAGVAAVQPSSFIPAFIRVQDSRLFVAGQEIPLSPSGSLAVIGAGKAGATMAQAFEAALNHISKLNHEVASNVNKLDRYLTLEKKAS